MLPISSAVMLLVAGTDISVRADFEGGSVKVIAIDQQAREVTFTPGGNPARGWPCWWHFRIDGAQPGETIKLKLLPSTAVTDKPGSKPLAASWSRPSNAAWSADGIEWNVGQQIKQAVADQTQTRGMKRNLFPIKVIRRFLTRGEREISKFQRTLMEQAD